jgi:uncharacterized protein (TIGR03435 family)
MKRRAALLSLTAIAFAQSQQPAARPKFDVASIKPSRSGDFNYVFKFAPHRFEARNAPVRFLIQFAWNVYDFQITGGPAWAGSARYNIEAVTDKNSNTEDHRLMIRALLEDRFQLTLHRETRQSQVYALVPAKGGIKIQASKEKCDAPAGPASPAPRCDNYSVSSNGMDATAITMQAFATALSQIMDRRVVDKTGYTERFDVHLKWAVSSTPGLDPDDSSSASNDQSIFAALQQQLGLKLESTKGPVDLLVIDRLERPSEN